MTNDSGAKFSVDIVVNLKRAIDNLKDLQKETSEAGEYLKALNIGGKDVDIEGIFLKFEHLGVVQSYHGSGSRCAVQK